MGIFSDCRKTWDTLDVGDGVTVQDLYCLTTNEKEMPKSARASVSSLLSGLTNRGLAEKKPGVEKQGNRFRSTYVKTKSEPGKNKPGPRKGSKQRLNQKSEMPNELDSLQIGNAILSVIEKLKQTNKELRDDKKVLSAEIRDLTQAKQQVEAMLEKAKLRILELNQNGKKTINLHELQDMVKTH